MKNLIFSLIVVLIVLFSIISCERIRRENQTGNLSTGMQGSPMLTTDKSFNESASNNSPVPSVIPKISSPSNDIRKGIITSNTSPPATYINPVDGSEMILIPAGEFIMGAKEDDPFAKENEKPAHKVFLDAFYISKYEVTNRQFKKFVRETGYKPQGRWNLFDKPEFQDHPVIYVTFIDAQAYCKWAGLALPTEAQWEKAARGTDGRLYPWGNKWDPNKCNNIDLDDAKLIARMNAIQGKRGTLPVGALWEDKSPFGVMDMAGNINEWCSDWYESMYYKRSPSRNPTGPEKGVERSIRGGGWSLPAARCRTTSRWSGAVDSDLDDYGFRCVSKGIMK